MKTMKKFYNLVSTETRPQGAGVAILLDGKSIKTPGKAEMLAPTQALANEIVKEWAGQIDVIKPDTMPLTQFVSTKIDRVSAQRNEIQAATLKYLNTDMVCYRVDAPKVLASAQLSAWNPVIEFIQMRFGIKLNTTTGLKAITHAQAAHDSIGDYVAKLDTDRFTILQIITSLSGSILIAIMFVEGALKPEQVLALARIEERYKDSLYDAEKYGQDPLQEKKDAAALVDLNAAKTYLDSL